MQKKYPDGLNITGFEIGRVKVHWNDRFICEELMIKMMIIDSFVKVYGNQMKIHLLRKSSEIII